MDLQTDVPSAMFIDAGHELLTATDRVQTAGELKELAEASGSLGENGPGNAGTIGEAFDRGYLLGLYTMRAMIAMNPPDVGPTQ